MSDLSVIKVIELIGTSKVSFDDALLECLNTAHKTLRNIKGAEIKSQNVKLDSKGKIEEYRVVVKLAFKYEK